MKRHHLTRVLTAFGAAGTRAKANSSHPSSREDIPQQIEIQFSDLLEHHRPGAVRLKPECSPRPWRRPLRRHGHKVHIDRLFPRVAELARKLS
jgi:hypothetical protein